MADGVFTPYSTVQPLFGALPSWVPVEEQERIASYQTYEEIYWNAPQTFKLLTRGSDTRALYVPSARIIIGTMNRYCGNGLGIRVDPAVGTPADQATITAAFTALFRRERFKTLYATGKRMGLIHGDWVFHIQADPTKPAGSRLRLMTVDPAAYFPVYADDDPDRLVKVHLAEPITDSGGKVAVKRQTYERLDNGTIQSSCTIYDVDKWTVNGAKPLAVVIPPTILPSQITAIPVYHIKNRASESGSGNPYGSSEIRGLERVLAGLNQSMTDEDLALALDGLGLYWTEDGPPVDADGNDTDWVLGPGRVVDSISGLHRVEGVKDVTPFGAHIDRIWQFTKDAAGANDAAIGNVEAQVAESGVALQLRMGPILAEASEKDDVIADVLTQMFFDLRFWFAAYEATNFGDAVLLPTFGDKLPVNKKAEVDLVSSLVSTSPPIMSTTTAREYLAAKGIQFAEDEIARIAQEQALMAQTQQAQTDPYAGRLDAAAAGDTSGDAGSTGA